MNEPVPPQELPTSTVEWAYWAIDTLEEIAEKRRSPLFPVGFKECLLPIQGMLARMPNDSILIPVIINAVNMCANPTPGPATLFCASAIRQLRALMGTLQEDESEPVPTPKPSGIIIPGR